MINKREEFMKSLTKTKKFLAMLLVAILIVPCAMLFTACANETGFTVKNGDTLTTVTTFEEALSKAEAGATITLNENVVLSEGLSVTKNLTIDGKGKYSIKASDEVASLGNLILVETTEETTLTLKDITIDANQKGRVIYVNQSNILRLENATIKNGYRDNTSAPGVYITAKAKLVMTGGSISNNTVASSYENSQSYDVVNSLDLWIGANASATIEGGKIGKMFINANSYSSANKGATVVKGGTIDSLYLEYGNGYGADLTFEGGNITKLLISTTQSDGNFVEVTAVKGSTYQGGITE